MTDIITNPDRFVRCYCTGVTRAQAIAAITSHHCTTVEELRAITGACGGCGSCRPELMQLIREMTGLAPADPSAGSSPP